MDELTLMSSMRVREESRLMLDWSIRSLLLLSSPSLFSSPPSCRAAASAKLNPFMGSVLCTKTREVRVKLGKGMIPSQLGYHLDISSFMGAKDIFGIVPPECRVDDDVYSSLVLISLRQKILR